MRHSYLLVIVIIASMLAGCNLASSSTTPTLISTNIPTLEFEQPSPTQSIPPASSPSATSITATPLSAEQAVFDRADQVIAALKDMDTATLAGYVHPQMGLRFSPYAFVKDTDLVFPANKLAGLLDDGTIYTWGAYAATGEPINLSFADYFSKFVYDEDFVNAPQKALNVRLGVSTSMDNSADFYSNAMIVEYYFPGFDPKYGGMDWRSLRLVFVAIDSNWYLAGIIHDQWTT